jgi:membrane protease subunit (stomatin/prohibitin family)
MEIETEQSHNAVAETIQKLRKQATAMLGDGCSPDNLAFAMAFVATEMSMQLLNSPAAAVPVLLQGIAGAALAKSRQDAAESDCAECSDDTDLERPEGVSLH